MGDVGKAVKRNAPAVGLGPNSFLDQFARGTGDNFASYGGPDGFFGKRGPFGSTGGWVSSVVTGNRNLHPANVKKQRDEHRRVAEKDANKNALLARQAAMAQGLGGGGSQASAEIDAYNQVLAAYAAQRAQMEAQQASQNQQGIAQLMMLLALL